MHFKIKRTTQLRKLMEAYCERQGKQITTVRFTFDGQRINENQTPADVRICRCPAQVRTLRWTQTDAGSAGARVCVRAYSCKWRTTIRSRCLCSRSGEGGACKVVVPGCAPL